MKYQSRNLSHLFHRHPKYQPGFCLILLSLIVLAFTFCLLTLGKANAATSRMTSGSYEVQWPNVNMGSGNMTSPTNKLGVTTGQTAAGLFQSTGFRIKSGFQYIYPLIPFAFSVSAVHLNFGSLTQNVLTNQQDLTLKIDDASAGGYQVTAYEMAPLTVLGTGTTIPDTTCDVGSPCTQAAVGTWSSNSTYGFGYTMTGTDVPSAFAGGTMFKRFAKNPPESPVQVMGNTPAGGLVPGKNKTAVMTMRINIGNLQPAGSYQNVIKFTAIPLY
jgi:hypothetical protein